MKTLITFSLLANLGLGIGTYAVYQKSHKPAAPSEAELSATSSKPKVAARKAFQPRLPTPGSKADRQFDWRVLESDDYKVYIANLRSIGCPNETIQDIIVADINALFAEKARLKPKPEFKFWEVSSGLMPGMTPESIDESMALEEEKRKVLEELLGTDVVIKPNMFAMMGDPLEAMFGFLPGEKQVQLMELLQNAEFQNVGDATEMQKRQTEKLKEFLTPDEYREYQLRLSPTAMSMRMMLGGFAPSKEEFLAIFDARAAFEEKYPNQAPLPFRRSSQGDAAQQEAAAQMQKVIEEKLGKERFEDYSLSSDIQYQQLSRFGTKQNLDKETVKKVYHAQKKYMTQVQELGRSGQAGQPTDPQAFQRSLQTAQSEVKGLLKPDAYQELVKNPQFQWLKEQPLPPPVPQQ